MRALQKDRSFCKALFVVGLAPEDSPRQVEVWCQHIPNNGHDEREHKERACADSQQLETSRSHHACSPNSGHRSNPTATPKGNPIGLSIVEALFPYGLVPLVSGRRLHHRTSCGSCYRSPNSCCRRIGLSSWSKSSAPMPQG